MDITFGTRSGEVVDMTKTLDPVDLGSIETDAEDGIDPFESVARLLFDSKELQYATWIEIDGERKTEPFDYPWHLPRWWED